MKREESLEELWDGRFYELEDLVPVGSEGCAGCADCCIHTGDSIILDPYDMCRLTRGLHKSFEEMIEKEIEIRLVDGFILPNLMVQDEENSGREDGCPFLDQEKRCSIHAFRPGVCRLFPMARYYTEDGFRYFLQKGECTGKGTPCEARLKEWLDTPDLQRYEAFVWTWHQFRKEVSQKLDLLTERSQEQVQRYLLQLFYVNPYPGKKDFYLLFEERMAQARKELKPLGI
ncbi:MAG: YkgJ family cysteine cluster protein [Eubacteriales bacterium]|nr:YkgJ family cysteine cluster protein [Eubacteriales bacterium]